MIAEGHGWFLKRYNRTRALQFMAMVEVLSPLQIIDVGLQEQRGSVELLRKFSDQNLTLADAMGLHIMDSNSIQTCWSTDFHLGLTRVPLVIDQY